MQLEAEAAMLKSIQSEDAEVEAAAAAARAKEAAALGIDLSKPPPHIAEGRSAFTLAELEAELTWRRLANKPLWHDIAAKVVKGHADDMKVRFQ
jgi:hypothetical protein